MLLLMGIWTDLAAHLLESAAEWAREKTDEADQLRREHYARGRVEHWPEEPPPADLHVVAPQCAICGAEVPSMERGPCPWCGSTEQPVIRPVATEV